MADTAIAITAGSGTNVDTRTEATNGNHRQVIVIGDPSTNAGVAPVDATKGLAVDLSATGANSTAVKVNVASGGIASGGIATGAIASGAVASGAFASGSVASGAFASGSISSGAIATGAIADFQTEDAAAPANPIGPMLLARRKDTLSASEVTTDGDVIALNASNKGKLHVASEIRLGDTVADTGSGTGGSATQRVIIDTSQLAALATTAQTRSAGFQLIDEPTDGHANIIDDAAFTPATTGIKMVGFLADEASTDSVNEGDGGAARITLDRKQIVTTQPHTAGGLSVKNLLDVDETDDDVKASAGQVYGFYAVNRTTSPRYVRFYNTNTPTVGSTAHVLGPIEIPANASDHTAFIWTFGGLGVPFDTAISVAATTGFADNDTGAPGANDVIMCILYA